MKPGDIVRLKSGVYPEMTVVAVDKEGMNQLGQPLAAVYTRWYSAKDDEFREDNFPVEALVKLD